MTRPLFDHPPGWDVATLEPDPVGEVIVEAGSGSTPDTSNSSAWGGPVPWLTPKEVTSASVGRWVSATERTLSGEGQRDAGRLWPAGTVMLTKRAPVGEVVINRIPMATNQGFMNFRCGRRLLPEYLYYWLKANRPYLDAVANGSTYPELFGSDLFELEIAFPAMSQQHAIIEILGALDDKVELNRQTNGTLEGIARAIFKSWFVDFDPVRAKVEGRPPSGLTAEVAALFPDGFVSSGLGEVPRGWSVSPLGTLCAVGIGGDWGEDLPFGSGVEVACLRGVDLGDLRSSGDAVPPRRWVAAKSLMQRSMDESDVLIAGSGAGPTGRPLWFASELATLFGGPVLYSNFCKRLRCDSPATAVYVDRCLQTMHESGEIWEYVNGTSVPNLDARALLSGKQIVVPPKALLMRFLDVARPIVSCLYSPESRILAGLRDVLLPRLLSGTLRLGCRGEGVQGA